MHSTLLAPLSPSPKASAAGETLVGMLHPIHLNGCGKMSSLNMKKNSRISVYLICLTLSIFLVESSQAQEPTSVQTDSSGNEKLGKYSLIAAYFGETITHPGLNFGIQYSFFEKGKTKLISNLNLGGYTHPRHHRALFLDAEAGIRRTTQFGLFSEFLLGVGYNHSWVNGNLYVRRGPDEVKKIRDKGRSHLMTSTSFGLGWDFSKKKDLPMNVFLRLKPLFVYPVNQNLLIQSSIMTGIIWKLNL